MKSIDLSKIKKVYFIGLGGIGVSAAARILKQTGKKVSGSDAAKSEITAQLNQRGIKVFESQQAGNIKPGIDLVVYSVAVPEENPERRQAKKFNIPQISYPQLLGLMLQNKYGIGISGTNGKTTTTAMLGKIFVAAGLDPTIVIGGKVDYLGGNCRVGKGRYFIFESDEYRRAFDNYRPKAALVTYIGEDHLDYYKNLAEIKKAFNGYLKRVSKSGFIFINSDDENSLAATAGCRAKIITFGIKGPADFIASNICQKNKKQNFKVWQNKKLLGGIVLPLPARYNVYNALAAIAAAKTLGIDFKKIKKSLAGFKGVWRRFEPMGKTGKTEIIVDYAHTPDAVRQTIEAAKEFYGGKKILAVFQPHQYSRTKKFFIEFAKSFNQADKAIIADIFYVVGRENPKDFNVSSRKLARAARANGAQVEFGGSLRQTEKIIRQNAKNFNVVLIMGAGDVYEIGKKLRN